MNNATAITCQNLTKTYSDANTTVTVLHSVSLTVQAGEMVAIIGPSGSGKSTLLHLLGGLDSPTAGSVTVSGVDINALSENGKSRLRNSNLGFIYQFHHLLPEFTALENVGIPLLIAGLDPAVAINRAHEFLLKVGLGAREHHRISELSGGERQRVAVARALVNNPKCVLADEPTGNLDSHTASQIFELMLTMNQTLGTAFVVVTHDLALAKKMQRILILQDGCLVDHL